jgi:hypothetical protein
MTVPLMKNRHASRRIAILFPDQDPGKDGVRWPVPVRKQSLEDFERFNRHYRLIQPGWSSQPQDAGERHRLQMRH